jgi:hypothetical protein
VLAGEQEVAVKKSIYMQSLKKEMYEGLDFGMDELSAIIKDYYEDIITFITQPVFIALFSEMMSLPPTKRPAYVHNVWLNTVELENRGLEIPEGILIQTSAFGDRRPTLFVVKKFLPEKYRSAWENVNWTFNNPFKEEDVPFDSESAWRLPLSVSVQNALLANNIDLESIPDESPEWSQPLDGDNMINSEKSVNKNDEKLKT